jgi:hypothetical protein
MSGSFELDSEKLFPMKNPAQHLVAEVLRERARVEMTIPPDRIRYGIDNSCRPVCCLEARLPVLMQKHNFRITRGPRGIWLTTLDAFRALAA